MQVYISKGEDRNVRVGDILSCRRWLLDILKTVYI